jgi:hypothetical protein
LRGFNLFFSILMLISCGEIGTFTALAAEGCPVVPMTSRDRALLKSASAGKTNLAKRFRLESCADYPRGGEKALYSDLAQALRGGLSCMAKLGPERAADALKLVAILNQNPVIRCDDPSRPNSKIDAWASATSSRCNTADFPQIITNNKAEVWAAPSSARNTLFHEMIHWLGYLHFQNVDLAYLVPTCCFLEGTGGRAMNHACGMLRKYKSTDSSTFGYQKDLALLMRMLDLATVDVPSVMTPVRETHDYTLLLAAAYGFNLATQIPPEQNYSYGGYDQSFLGLIYGSIALEAMPREQANSNRAEFEAKIADYYFPLIEPVNAKKRDFAAKIGQAIASSLKSEYRDWELYSQEAAQLARETCPLLTGREKEQLKNLKNFGPTLDEAPLKQLQQTCGIAE